MGNAKRLSVFAAASSAAVWAAATAGVAQPLTYTSVATGDWTDPGTWDLKSAFPVTGDTVIIDGEVVTITGRQAARSVTVTSGQLKIDGSGCERGCAELKFGPGEAGPSLSITPSSGVELLGSARIVVGQSMAFAGAIYPMSGLQGSDSRASIVLVPSGGGTVTLTNDHLIIRGALVIREAGNGQGRFVNAGIVRADGDGVFAFDSSLDAITDSPSTCELARWRVEAHGAVLRFERAASLAGNFHVGPGRLDIDRTVSTAYLEITHGGSITPHLLSGWFFFQDHCPDSDCAWISSPVISPVRCHE